MSSLIDSLCYDILGDLCLGKSFEIKEPAANPLEFVPHAIAKYMHLMYMVGQIGKLVGCGLTVHSDNETALS